MNTILLTKSNYKLGHILEYSTCDTTISDLYNWNYGSRPDHITIELSARSHKAPQTRLKYIFNKIPTIDNHGKFQS